MEALFLSLPYLIAIDFFFSFVSYVIRLASRIGGLVTLLRSKVSKVHVVQEYDVCKGRPMWNLTLGNLPLPLLLPCYGRTTVMMVHVSGIGIVVCCLLLLMMMMFCLLAAAAAAAAVAAAYIGGNISYLHVPYLPYLGTSPYITP